MWPFIIFTDLQWQTCDSNFTCTLVFLDLSLWLKPLWTWTCLGLASSWSLTCLGLYQDGLDSPEPWYLLPITSYDIVPRTNTQVTSIPSLILTAYITFWNENIETNSWEMFFTMYQHIYLLGILVDISTPLQMVAVMNQVLFLPTPKWKKKRDSKRP